MIILDLGNERVTAKNHPQDPAKDADFAWVCAGRMCYYVSTSVAAFMCPLRLFPAGFLIVDSYRKSSRAS